MRTIDDELKPVRHNIAVRSFFDRNKEAAEHNTKRIGMGACTSRMVGHGTRNGGGGRGEWT